MYLDLMSLTFNLALFSYMVFKFNKLEASLRTKQELLIKTLKPFIKEAKLNKQTVSSLEENLRLTGENIAKISNKVDILNGEVSSRIAATLSAQPSVTVVNESPAKYLVWTLVIAIVVCSVGTYLLVPKAVVLTKSSASALSYSINSILGRLPGANSAEAVYSIPSRGLQIETKIINGIAEHQIVNLVTKVSCSVEEFILNNTTTILNVSDKVVPITNELGVHLTGLL